MCQVLENRGFPLFVETMAKISIVLSAIDGLLIHDVTIQQPMNAFLKLSFRHLWQSKLYAAINIFGLAVGITCMLMAVLYWSDEHSFDNFHKNNPNLYRVTTTLIENKGDNVQTVGGTGQVQGPAFKQSVPEVKSFVRVLGGDIYSDVIANGKGLKMQPLFADNNFFEVFSFPLLKGDPKTVLSTLESVVLTETTAMKFFNSIDVVGKMITMDADPSFERLGRPLVVSGVMKDPPANSSFQFDLVFNFQFMRLSFEDESWTNAYMGTFVVLDPGSDVDKVTQKFNAVYAMRGKEQLSRNIRQYGYDPGISYGLQPITDIHLNPLIRTSGNVENGVINGSSPVYSYMFLSIAAFILLMAGINFVNITIANSLQRSKEVGIRKISGGSRLHIIMQFINESVILCCIALTISLVLLSLSLPFFNSLAGKQMLLSQFTNWKFLVALSILFLLVVGLTGIYPALIVARFNPCEVLYNKQRLSGRNVFGKGLVITQYSLAIFLLIAAIVYHNQMDYVRTKDLGYNPNQVLRTNVGGDRDYRSVITYLKNDWVNEPSIKNVSFGSDGYPEKMEVNNRIFKAQYKNIDENFLQTLQVHLLAGHNVAPLSSNVEVLVNEAFVKAAQIDNPVGTPVKVYRYEDTMIRTIAGVVKDFHFGSLRESILPMLMYTKDVPDGGVWIKFDQAKQKQAMAAVERSYKQAMPNAVYQYNFLDELNARQYFQEQRWQQVITAATAIAFSICCLGLFGLAHLSTSRRVKEIGIRKVLGATVSQITAMLSADFLKLVLIAFVIAAPAAWLVIKYWLQQYAYRTDISVFIFITAGAIAIMIALLAVSFQSIKAAIANPAKSLKTE